LILVTAAASAFNHVLEKLDSKVSKYIDGNPIRVDGRPRASGVLDTVRAAVANGVKVPGELTEPAVIDVIVRRRSWLQFEMPTNAPSGEGCCEGMV
jgi:hypothetical protein